MSVNQVNILGRIGKIETKAMPNGKSVTSFSVATTEKYKDQAGQMVEDTEWHNCVSFGAQADVIAQWFQKGSEIFVSGKLKTRKWQDQSGQDRYTTNVIVNNFSFTGGSKNDSQQNSQSQGHSQQQNNSQNDWDNFSDDVPF